MYLFVGGNEVLTALALLLLERLQSFEMFGHIGAQDEANELLLGALPLPDVLDGKEEVYLLVFLHQSEEFGDVHLFEQTFGVVDVGEVALGLDLP